MPKNQRQVNSDYWEGFEAGKAASAIEKMTNIPHAQQKFYDLTPHDLDTLAMGIALVVLHAADIQTIATTMDTQQKLGVAEKVLGWLHLICIHPEEYGARILLNESDPNPWLNPDIVPGWEEAAAQQFEKPEFPNGEFGKPEEADDDIPY